MLLLVTLIDDLIGILHACAEQGEQRLCRNLLPAQGVGDILNQGLDSEPTGYLPLPLSSHPICHQQEDKRG